MLTKLREAYGEVTTINRYYLTLILLCTTVHMLGLPAAELFSLSLQGWYELWRPLTSAAYFGAPSMSMANSIYFLLNFGQLIERLDGSGTYAYFLLVQAAILTLMSLALGFPFTSRSMITAIIYNTSRTSPMDTM